MLKLLRVQGDSMCPRYRSADYLLVARPLWRRLQAGDDVVARHPRLGTIFKRIAALDGDRLWLSGLGANSTSSADIGSVARSDLVGRVILHFSAPGRDSSAGTRGGGR